VVSAGVTAPPKGTMTITHAPITNADAAAFESAGWYPLDGPTGGDVVWLAPMHGHNFLDPQKGAERCLTGWAVFTDGDWSTVVMFDTVADVVASHPKPKWC